MKTTHYISFIFLLLCSVSFTQAQVMIGDGLTISEGTTMRVQNQNVTISTDEIRGKGNLIVSNTGKQIIVVSKELHTDVSIDVKSENIELKGNSKQYFALEFLPPFSTEIILAKEERIKEEKLPVRFVNFQGLSFKIESEKQFVYEDHIDLRDITSTIHLTDVLQVKAAPLNSYYIIPIYSFLLNDERSSDHAELYKFECLTALLKPPIA